MQDFTQTRLVAFDLDGTLTESKQPLEPRMGNLLADLMTRMPIAVMSGGSFGQFKEQFFSGLPERLSSSRLYIFPTNAAQGYVLINSEWQKLYEHQFSDEEKQEILTALNDALAYAHLDVPPEKLWGEQIEDRNTQITWSALGQAAPPEEKKRWDPLRTKRLPARERLVELLPEYSIGINATTSIDITKKGITKAYGVRQLAEITNIPIKHMLYIGDALKDGGNDAVVKETGIHTQETSGPEETEMFIKEITT